MKSDRNKTHEGSHKYFRSQFKKSQTIIYRCAIPDCPHFIYEPLIVGRLSLCNRCDEEFVVTKRSLRSKRLHCESCSRGRYNKKIEVKKKLSVLESDIDNILAMGKLREIEESEKAKEAREGKNTSE